MDELKSGEITRDEYFEWKINWHRPVMVVENMSQSNNGEYSKYNAPQNWKIPITGELLLFFNLMLFYYMYFSSLNYFIASICDYTNLFAFSFDIFFFQTSIKCLFPNNIFTSIWILLSNYFATNLNICT